MIGPREKDRKTMGRGTERRRNRRRIDDGSASVSRSSTAPVSPPASVSASASAPIPAAAAPTAEATAFAPLASARLPLPTPGWLDRLAPDRSSPLSLGRQLYLALYEAITGGELPDGAALPPSRALAIRLGVARNTVVAAYAQLGDEGLVAGGGRRGTLVTHPAPAGRPAPAGTGLAARARSGSGAARSIKGSPSAPWTLSTRSSNHAATTARHRAFAPGEPDPSLFPARDWQRAMARAARLPPEALGYRDGAPLRLREAIARHLAVYRSLVVDPARIVVTSGTRQSLLLAAALFADAGETAWVETPGYRGAVDAFRAQGLRLRDCAIDAEGAIPPTGPPPRLVYLTPCFQYPLGMPLSPARREAFLALSARHGTVLFEDDYDSEFRDDAQPRPALAARAAEGSARVLHAGTFSKLIFPAARVAWLVVPEGHAERAGHVLRGLGGGHGTLAQSVVAELLDAGTISRHLQRARQVYARRRQVLLECVAGSERLRLDSGGGLSAVLSFERAASLEALESALDAERLGAVPLERFRGIAFVETDTGADVVAAANVGGGTLQGTASEASAPTPAPSEAEAMPRRSRKLVLGLGNVDSLALPETFFRLERAVRRAGASG